MVATVGVSVVIVVVAIVVVVVVAGSEEVHVVSGTDRGLTLLSPSGKGACRGASQPSARLSALALVPVLTELALVRVLCKQCLSACNPSTLR